MTNIRKLQKLIEERNEIEAKIQEILVVIAQDKDSEERKVYAQKHPVVKKGDMIRITAYHGIYSQPIKACVGAELRVTSTWQHCWHENITVIRCITKDGRACIVKNTLHDWEIIK